MDLVKCSIFNYVWQACILGCVSAGDSTAITHHESTTYPDAAGEAGEMEKGQNHEEDVKKVGGILLPLAIENFSVQMPNGP